MAGKQNRRRQSKKNPRDIWKKSREDVLRIQELRRSGAASAPKTKRDKYKKFDLGDN